MSAEGDDDAPVEYFHICYPLIAPNAVLQVGNFGRVISLFGYKHPLFGREIALEAARLRARPDAVSRLSCVFAFASETEAKLFQIREPSGFQGANIYAVTPVSAATKIFMGRLWHLENWAAATASNPDHPARYWLEGHPMPSPIALTPTVPMTGDSYEILIGGPVRINRRVGP